MPTVLEINTSPLTTFGDAGTLAAFGFLLAYFLITDLENTLHAHEQRAVPDLPAAGAPAVDATGPPGHWATGAVG